METKDQLIKTIKEWVKLDNDIRKLQKEIAQRKNDKKTLSTTLIDVMKKNEIDNFDISNGQICYNKKNIKKPITKKTLLDILAKFYKGDLLKASETNSFILDNREEEVKETIVLKLNKISS
jgi:coenzyme F420-reducing hydrogenase alpha subunit